MNYSIYDLATGNIICSGNISFESKNLLTKEGEGLIVGVELNPIIHYVTPEGVVLERTTPSTLQQTALINEIRCLRNITLTKIDTVYCNAERWSSMSAEQHTLWSIYKQLLRDFPETCDIDNPVWPIQPS